MATVAASQTPSTAEPLRRQHWNVVTGLWWAAILLGLLAGWVFIKHYAESGGTIGWIVVVLSLATLGAALWQTRVNGLLKKEPDEQQEKVLTQLRPRIGLLLLAVSVVVIAVMGWLFFQERMAAFAEAISGALLGLLGLIVAIGLLNPPGKGLSQQRVLEKLVTGRKQFQVACLAVGGVLFVLGLWIFMTGGDWWLVFPQGAGAMLLGLIFLGVGLWLLLSTAKEVTATQMRMLILIAGGTAGLVIAVMTGIRAFLWWDQLFGGGLNSWRGADAWRLWTCIYLELLGLALMFGSLFLAQADIRFNPVLRRLLYGYNAVFTGLLVLAVLVVLNIVVYATYPYTFNWTQGQGFYALSESSKNILHGLTKPTKVYVLMAQSGTDYMDVKNLLENAQAYSNMLRVEEISPDQSQKEYERLVTKYPKLKEASQSFSQMGGRGLLVVYGAEEKNPRHEFIPAKELSSDEAKMGKPDQDRPAPRHEFKGEDLLMTRLKFLIGGQEKPAVYFTQSNKEVDVKNNAPRVMEAGGFLAEKLTRANYQVKQLFWDVKQKGLADEGVAFTKKAVKDPHKIPDDARVIVIAWPKTPFSKDVIEALGAYMSKGGRLVVLSNVIDTKYQPVDVGLKDFMKNHGVDFTENYVIHMQARFPRLTPDISIAKTPPQTTQFIANQFARNFFLFDCGRSVKPLGGKAGFQAEVILEVEPQQGEFVWAETDLTTLAEPEVYVEQLFRTNKLLERRSSTAIPVGVAVADGKGTARLVVFGMGREASNAPLIGGLPYHDLIVNSVEWLGDRPIKGTGIPPKASNYYALPATMTPAEHRRMILLPFALMSLGLIGIGMGVWVVRRT